MNHLGDCQCESTSSPPPHLSQPQVFLTLLETSALPGEPSPSTWCYAPSPKAQFRLLHGTSCP